MSRQRSGIEWLSHCVAAMMGLALLCLAIGCGGNEPDGDGSKARDGDKDKAAAVKDSRSSRDGTDDIADGPTTFYFSDDTTDADLEAIPKSTENIWVYGESKVTTAGFAHLANLPRLKRLEIYDTFCTDEVMEHIGKLTTLEKLDLSGDTVTDVGMKHLEGLVNLQELVVSSDNVSNLGVSYFAKMTKLRVLELNQGHFTPIVFRVLKDLKDLRRLDFSYIGELDDQSMEWFSNFTKLERANIHDRGELTDAAAVHVAKMVGLRKIELHGLSWESETYATLKSLQNLREIEFHECENVTDGALAFLADMPALRSVRIIGGHRLNGNVFASLKNVTTLYLDWPSGGMFEFISQMTNLTSLDLEGDWDDDGNFIPIKVSAEQFAHVANLKNLSSFRFPGLQVDSLEPLTGLPLAELDLRDAPLDDKAIAPLAKMTGLETVYIWNSTITTLEPFRTMRNLRHLNVNETKVKDIEPVTELPRLRYLELSSTAVTDDSLLALYGMNQLSGVELNRTAITRDGYLKLNRRRPRLGIGNYNTAAAVEGDSDFYSEDEHDDASFADIETTVEYVWIGSHSKNLTVACLEHLKRLPNLRRLGLSEVNFSDEALKTIGELKSLETLELNDCPNLTNEGLAHLLNLKSLISLDVTGDQITADAMEHVQNLTSLESLNVHGLSGKFTDDQAKMLGKLVNLRTLSLGHGKISDEGMAHLGGLQNVEEVRLPFSEVSDTSIAVLAKLKKVREINLTYSQNFTDQGVAQLAALPNLRVLNISHTGCAGTTLGNFKTLRTLTCSHVSAEGIVAIGKLTNLDSLDTSFDDSVTPEQLKPLGNLVNLYALMLEANALFTNLDMLEPLQQLNVLQLKGAEQIDDEDVQVLSTLTALREMDISGTAISNLEFAKPLRRLKELDVGQTQIDDADLEVIHNLPGLESLSTSGSKVTKAAADRLERSSENLSVSHY